MLDEVDPVEQGKEPSRAWLDAALAEHGAIRGDIVAALTAQHSVFSYGVAAVGLLTAVAIGATKAGVDGTGDSTQNLALSILLVLNPVLLLAVFVLWTSEVLRMQRAGTYLFALESVINARMGEPVPLAWEGVVNPPPDTGRRDERKVSPHRSDAADCCASRPVRDRGRICRSGACVG